MEKVTKPLDDLSWLYPHDHAGVAALHRLLWKESKLTLVYWIVVKIIPFLMIGEGHIIDGLNLARLQTETAQVLKREKEILAALKASEKHTSAKARITRINHYEKLRRLDAKYNRLQKLYDEFEGIKNEPKEEITKE